VQDTYQPLENLLLFYQSVDQKFYPYITNANIQIANTAKIFDKIYRNSSMKPMNIISGNYEIKMSIIYFSC
jgi:hypothetical protein